MINYIKVISRKFPDVQCHVVGDPTVYANIVWETGDPLPSEVDLQVAALDVAKEDKKEEINLYRDDYAFDYFLYDGFIWDCDDTSRLNIIGINTLVLINGGTLPPGMMWRDYNNVDHAVDGPYMVNMGLTMFNFISAAYQAGWQHKANVDALTTIEEVDSYDFISTLWPARNP